MALPLGNVCGMLQFWDVFALHAGKQIEVGDKAAANHLKHVALRWFYGFIFLYKSLNNAMM